MKIKVTDSIWLTEFSLDDVAELTHFLNNKAIYDTTINIPFPYTERNARDWIKHTLQERSKGKIPHNWAVRLNDSIIGGIGVMPKDPGVFEHQAEIGYWIAVPYWNRGFMTIIVGAFSNWVFQNFPLRKLTASIFAENIASEKVLLKNGFECEGFCKQHVYKDRKFIDCKLFAKFRF